MQRHYGPLEERKVELTSEAEFDALSSEIVRIAAVLCEIAPLPALIEGRDALRAMIEGRLAVPAEIGSIEEVEQMLLFHERAIQKRVQ